MSMMDWITGRMTELNIQVPPLAGGQAGITCLKAPTLSSWGGGV